jgi:hypothetical protein
MRPGGAMPLQTARGDRVRRRRRVPPTVGEADSLALAIDGIG